MATVDDLDRAIEQWRLATAEFIRGTPYPHRSPSRTERT